jgi:hypothetical protein
MYLLSTMSEKGRAKAQVIMRLAKPMVCRDVYTCAGLTGDSSPLLPHATSMQHALCTIYLLSAPPRDIFL